MGPNSKKHYFSTLILRGQYGRGQFGHSHGPQQRPHPILAGIGRNFLGTLPDSVSSAPEIFRSVTQFLLDRCGTEVKKAPFFNSDFEGLVWAPTRPPAKTPPNSCKNGLKLFWHTAR